MSLNCIRCPSSQRCHCPAFVSCHPSVLYGRASVSEAVFSLLIVAIGVYAKVQKATDTVRDTFLIDPAVILIVVGVVMFFITFCGCIGALRENIRLLKTFSFSLTLVFLTQLAIAIMGFFYSDQTRDALGKFVKKAIVHYRDDLDLQNLMDYIQKEVPWPLPLSWTGCASVSNHNQSPQSCMSNGLGEGLPHERLHVTYSSCSLWVSSCDIPPPSVHAGMLESPGFPMGEAQTGRISSVAGGTTTQTGLGTCTLIAHTREPPSTERCAVPYSCCTPVPGEAVINTMCGFGVQTQNYLEANKSIYPVGCADRAVMWIESHLLLVGALALGLALPQVTPHTRQLCTN
ncbi:hypothetical protein L3Q82_024138, partial [Scortum barcoo]